ncbi:MAG: non-heme Fe2+,alpha-ketoglutarate-dependent halogenase [Phenylobacterium sp.]|jgi:non-heme Fe2+,alpha-ketoglutarate-dependent halogenase
MTEYNQNPTILTPAQLTNYQEVGVIDSINILSPQELAYYRAQIEKLNQAFDNTVVRMDGLHLFFDWAWDLASHPKILDCMERLTGPDILIESTRLFYKHGNTGSYVGWHQDGYTLQQTDNLAPAIWLGLTEATRENGCLRVIPGSHLHGPLSHVSHPGLSAVKEKHLNQRQQPLTSYNTSGDETSGRIAQVPEGYHTPQDIVMQPGQMSLHHPLVLHGSEPNHTTEPRIGLSVSYTTPQLHNKRASIPYVRGQAPADYPEDIAPELSFDEAVAAYRISNRNMLFLP